MSSEQIRAQWIESKLLESGMLTSELPKAFEYIRKNVPSVLTGDEFLKKPDDAWLIVGHLRAGEQTGLLWTSGRIRARTYGYE